ncbi:hypothetical protein Pmani_017019 [Petrolisthes manimaculis]|uniref:Reverse transcriptase domain-containing protein n=1 Tax=Petrolisthes manimaculis TaxID=1843537 RepID=A0AAE1PNV6_9EUCA|nr:hypothetical protein Pmani_017019 [Petrolisthes manimaculis]
MKTNKEVVFCWMPVVFTYLYCCPSLMDSVTRGLDFVFVYLDDILVASRTRKEHCAHLKQLCQKLDQHGLAINLAKSLANKPKELIWDDEASTALSNAKEALAKATMLVHPRHTAPAALTVDASAIAVVSDPWSARQQRHLTYISEYTTNIQHLSGKNNLVADALSRATINVLALGVDYVALATAQKDDNEARLTGPDWTDELPWVIRTALRLQSQVNSSQREKETRKHPQPC